MNFDFKTIPDTLAIGIGKLRQVIIDLIVKFGGSSDIYSIIALAISLFASYKILNQWVVGSMFTKFSTILNWLLLSLLFYMALVYVR